MRVIAVFIGLFSVWLFGTAVLAVLSIIFNFEASLGIQEGTPMDMMVSILMFPLAFMMGGLAWMVWRS